MRKRTTLTIDDKRFIAKYYEDHRDDEGVTYKSVAQKFGVSVPSVDRYTHDYRSYKDLTGKYPEIDMTKVTLNNEERDDAIDRVVLADEAAYEKCKKEEKEPTNRYTVFHIYMENNKVLDIQGSRAELNIETHILTVYWWDRIIAVMSGVCGYVDTEFRVDPRKGGTR